MRWLDEEKTGQIFILVPTTPVTRKAIGFSSTQCASKFLGSITSEFFRCHHYWDSVLGGKWDLLPARNERELDFLIKSLKFNEHTDFLMSTIRCHINACRGRYAVEDNYREVLRYNTAESAQDFFMTWSEQLELFILFVVMTVFVRPFVFIWSL